MFLKKMCGVLIVALFFLAGSVFSYNNYGHRKVNMTLAYLNQLLQQKYVTKADVLKVVAYLAGKKDISDLKQDIRFLYKKGIIRKIYQNRLTKYANRGYIAYLVNKTLKLRHGIWESLFGNKYRITYRKLVKYRIIPKGGYRFYPSGLELVGIIGKANKFREGEMLW
jgi:hypothetical protein